MLNAVVFATVAAVTSIILLHNLGRPSILSMSAFTEANRKAFNDLASSYQTKPWQQKLASQVSDALQERKDWIGVQWACLGDGRDVKLLDYACGTGAITKALGPYVNTIRGIDVSEKMVEEYNKAAHSSGLTNEQANAVVGDLVGDSVPEKLNGPEYENFDVAVIGLGFHHFEHPQRSIKRLAERLKPGIGVLVIVDWLPSDHGHKSEDDHQKQHSTDSDMGEMSHTIKHDGFERDDMKKLFDEAGLVDFGWHVLPEPSVLEMKTGTRSKTLFIAKAARAPTASQKSQG